MVTSSGDVLYQAGTLLWADLPAQDHPGVADALRGESGTTYLTIDGEEHAVAFSLTTPNSTGTTAGAR